MGTLKKKEIPMWAKAGHRKPVTRREFLGFGLIPFAASALVPGALGLLLPGPQAHADTSCGAASDLIPFITLNLSGGAAMCGNFVPRDAGGNLLSAYDKLGLPSGAPMLTSEFGVKSFAGGATYASQMIAGIRAMASSGARANTAFIATCVQSNDDTSFDKFDASGMVIQAGLKGTKLPNLGRRGTTGVGQVASTVTPPQPLIVGSFTDLVNSIGYTSALKNQLSSSQRVGLAKLVASLTGSQARKLASINSVAQVQDLLNCAGVTNASVIQNGAQGIDPVTAAPAMASVWNVTSSTSANSQDRVFSAMVYNGLVGNAGTVSLEIGGYDYHDQTRATGNRMDLMAGQTIGKILESAHVLGKKVFIYVTSDGAITADPNKPDNSGPSNGGPGGLGGPSYSGDRGVGGGSFMFLYDPSGRPATSGFQVGNFTSQQVADSTTSVGSNPEIAAQAAFANYLKFNNRMDLFAPVEARGILTGAALNEVVKVG